MSKKQKTISGCRQKMRKYLKWARQNAQEFYEEVWGTLQANGAETPDDLTMVPSEVLIAEHDKLREVFQIFVQAREEEKRKEVVSKVNNPGPATVEEPQLQRQQVEERASKLLARIEDDAASGDVPEEILTALLVNNWSEIPVQALKSMVDVLERKLDAAEREAREAKTAKYAEANARMRVLADEDRAAETGQVLEVTLPPSVQTEESPEAIVPVTPQSPTPAAGVVEEKPKQRRRVEWEDCPGKGNPWCMGRKKVGFKHCAGCHQYQKETAQAVPAVVDEAELWAQEEAEQEAVQRELLAALELKAEALGLLKPGVKGYITKLLNDETKGIRAAIEYLTGKVEPEVVVVAEVEGLPAVETMAPEVDDPVVEDGLRFCQHCNRKKPADTFRVFEDRYPWLPKGYGILNWVGVEICARSVFDLNEAAQKRRDRSPQKSKENECPRCHEPVSREKRKSFEVRQSIPENHWIRKWENVAICWQCIKYLAGKAYEVTQEAVVKTPTHSSSTMPEGAWAALLGSEEIVKSGGLMRRETAEPVGAVRHTQVSTSTAKAAAAPALVPA